MQVDETAASGAAIGPSSSHGTSSAASVRLKRFLPFLGYLALQGLGTAGMTTPRFPDSLAYTQLSFTGGTKMLPTIPLLYHLVPSDAGRVAVQTVIAACCWWDLAKVASRMVAHPRVRLGLRLVVLVLGVVEPIASWNTTILSESVSISLTVLLISCMLRYLQRPGARSVLAFSVVMLAWTFARQAQVILALMVTLVLVLAALGHWRERTRLALAVICVVISGLGVVLVGRNKQVTVTNLADIIADRILLSPSYTTWFVVEGMPYSQAIQQAAGSEYGIPLVNNPTMSAWLAAHGEHVYGLFLLEHPSYSLWEPLPYFSGEVVSLEQQPRTTYLYTEPEPKVSMLSPTANWGRYRQVVPTVVEELLFQQGQIGDVIALAIGAFGLTYVSLRRYGRDRRLWVPLLIVASVVPQGYFVWITGGVGELDRLSIIVAVTARIGLWMTLALSLDRLLTHGAPPPGGPGGIEAPWAAGGPPGAPSEGRLSRLWHPAPMTED